MHVVIVTNLPSPYRISLFNALSKKFLHNSIRLTVLFLSRGYEGRKWKVDESTLEFNHTYVKNRHLVIGDALIAFSPALLRALYALKPDVIIVGSMGFPALWTLIYAALHSIHYLVWSGETRIQSQRRADLLGVRTLFRRLLCRRAWGAIAYGTDSLEFLCHLGMAPERIEIGINTVDTAFFSRFAEGRARTIPNKIRFLYVGHFTRLKGLHELLSAFSQLDSAVAELHFVGGGEEEDRLQQYVRKKKLMNVYFWGFRQKDELPDMYAKGDIFVFPSFYDVWGLVCIEAMASGLPVISSCYAGCTRDLIKDGENGFMIDPHNSADILEKLLFFVTNRKQLPRFQRAARDAVQNGFLIDHSIMGFERILQKMGNLQ